MLEFLSWSAIFLAATGAASIGVLALRRVLLAREEHARCEAEERLRPVALALVGGERVVEAIDADDAEHLARLLARYARVLTGESKAQVAAFFESRGLVGAEVEKLRRRRRAWQRATAAFALGDMSSSAAVQPLIAALEDPSRDVRAAAARSLGGIGAPEAVEPLVYALASQAVPRGVAGHALLAIGPAALPSLRELERRAETAVRVTAVELVGYLGDASEAPLLVERIADGSAEVRAKAARALGRLAASEAADALRAALADRIPFVRAAAAIALGAVGGGGAVEALLDQARTDAFEPAHAAARALAAVAPDVLIAAAAAPDAGPHLHEAADLLAVRA